MDAKTNWHEFCKGFMRAVYEKLRLKLDLGIENQPLSKEQIFGI